MRRWIGLWIVVGLLAATSACARNQIFTHNDPPPYVVEDGDPLWKPTKAQLAEWVASGVQAAAAGMYLPDLPVVGKWMRTFDPPIPAAQGRQVRFIILMSPELGATVAGYAAAWHEPTWEEMRQNRDRVIGGIASRLSHEYYGARLYVAAGMLGDEPGSPDTSVHGGAYAPYYKDEWRRVDISKAGSLAYVLKSEWTSGSPNAKWALGYLLGQMGDYIAMVDGDRLSIRFGTWPRRPQYYPVEQFDFGATPPAANTIRIAIGTDASFAYADFPLR